MSSSQMDSQPEQATEPANKKIRVEALAQGPAMLFQAQSQFTCFFQARRQLSNSAIQKRKWKSIKTMSPHPARLPASSLKRQAEIALQMFTIARQTLPTRDLSAADMTHLHELLEITGQWYSVAAASMLLAHLAFAGAATSKSTC